MTTRRMAALIGLVMFGLSAVVASAEETVSFESVNQRNFFIRHRFFLGELTTIDRSNPIDVADATFIVRPALNGTPGAVSFESVNYRGYFLRHEYFRLRLDPTNTDHHPESFREDASFMPGLVSFAGIPDAVSYGSVNFPGFSIRHRDYHLFLEKLDDNDPLLLDSVFRKIPALAVAQATAGGNAGGDQVPAEWGDMLAAFNQKRALHCVPPLTWSASLAVAAQAWANQCTNTHESEAANPVNANPGQWGENLSQWSPPGFANNTKVFQDSWYCEIQWYDFNNPVVHGGFKNACDPPVNGHFTQIVWKDTTEIGCGKATCPNLGGDYWVCKFSPPGNVNAGDPNVLRQEVLPATCPANQFAKVKTLLIPSKPAAGGAGIGKPMVNVPQDVDLYAAPGGSGNSIGMVKANSKVSVMEARPDHWCHIAGNTVPKGSGWVWCGEGFELK